MFGKSRNNADYDFVRGWLSPEPENVLQFCMLNAVKMKIPNFKHKTAFVDVCAVERLRWS